MGLMLTQRGGTGIGIACVSTGTGGDFDILCGLVLGGRHPSSLVDHPIVCLDEVWESM